jgi:hypothetical protein
MSAMVARCLIAFFLAAVPLSKLAPLLRIVGMFREPVLRMGFAS